MRTAALLLLGLAAGVSAPGIAQVAPPTKAPASVDDYLCTFAGKCGAAATPDATPTMAAPATKGFRLAAPQATAAAAAPAAAPHATHVATAAAPHLAVAARTRPVAPRAPVGAGTRADLRLAFDYNSVRMTPMAQARARTFAQALVTPELRDRHFLIEGHTDSRGSREFNMDLSRRRAQAVADFLAGQGVESGRIEVKGVGPDQPLPGHTPASEANRRVEAVLLS